MNGYVDSLASLTGEKFPYYYLGKATNDQDFPFNSFANGSVIPSGQYRLFGAALAYPKDITTSLPSDLNTYISTPFIYNVQQTPKIEPQSGISISGSLMGYNSLSKNVNSPYDTIYISLSVQAPNGIIKGDIASVFLPKELAGFPGSFKFQSKSGEDIGLASIDSKTNELRLKFRKSINATIVTGNIGLFSRLKDPDGTTIGRRFYKFTNLGVDQFTYLNFKKVDSTVPRVGCRADRVNGWLDVDIPSSFGNWSYANITAMTSSGEVFNGRKVKVVDATALDVFGNITKHSDADKSLYSVRENHGIVNIDLKSPSDDTKLLVRSSIPLIFGNYGQASEALAKVQIFNGVKDTTFNLDCRFDTSGMISNSFSFEGQN